VFSTLLAYNIKRHNDIDPRVVILIAL
jgi:hypothetical protein